MNGLRSIPLINGVEPAWANIVINIAGVPEVGVTSIEYSDSQEMENIYGASQYPVGRGVGKIEATAKITLLRSAVESIREASDTGRLQDIAPFDIIVSFIPMNGGSKVITHKIRNCQFKVDSLTVSKDDLSIETDFDLLPSHIEWK